MYRLRLGVGLGVQDLEHGYRVELGWLGWGGFQKIRVGTRLRMESCNFFQVRDAEVGTYLYTQIDVVSNVQNEDTCKKDGVDPNETRLNMELVFVS